MLSRQATLSLSLSTALLGVPENEAAAGGVCIFDFP